jgi:hypothetical protein
LPQGLQQLLGIPQPLDKGWIEPGGGLCGQHLIDAAQGHEQLRTGGGQFAVAQIGELGVVHAPQGQPLRQGGEHPLTPAVALMPHPDQVPKRIPP